MSTSTPPTENVFQGYAALDGMYDEVLAESGEVREHARPFVEMLNRLGHDEFARRWNQSQQVVHENGVAFSGYGTPNGKPRPWELDAIPLVISSSDWQHVSTALEQRARLLNLVLQDLYGEQSLLSSGVLPPELVYAHPGFLRAIHGLHPPGGRHLHFYAADLARGRDGKWWVLSDRTDAPSGLGFALENRIVISRMLPDVFRDCQVQRLAAFFMAMQKALLELAADRRVNPHVAFLSHGPTSANFFENAYLARYLGYTLVEDGDLAVRKDKVMLKTLGGLLPVDVIVRHQNSDECDPLELGDDSGFGVAGLTQAIRLGNVSVANALGSGLVESTAFMPFLPQLCRTLLGEELMMPGIATWWCGQPEGLAYVLENLDSLTVLPAFRRRGKDGPVRESYAKMPREELAALIRANPVQFAAQERADRSGAPVWHKKLESAFVALRSYLVSSDDGYEVMPGALARTSSSLDPLDVSIRRGEGSKDTWVLADGPVEQVTLLEEPGQAVTLRRIGTELPSRAADNLYWLGRQLERADASARLLRSTASRMTGETRSTSDAELPMLLRCLADQGQIEPGYAVEKMKSQLPAIEQALPAAVFDSTQSASLRSALDEMLRIGAIVRDRMSLDTWHIIHRIGEGFRPNRFRPTNLFDLMSKTDELITELAAFSGIIVESMTRTQAFRFLELGRRLERSLQIISLVKNCFIPMPNVHGPILETVLEVADSLMTYRSRYFANLQLAAVLDLLLTDEINPRSLAYQFVQLEEHVDQLPRQATQPGYTAEQRIAMSLLHSIRMLDIEAVAERHGMGDYQSLEDLCEEWESQIPRLSEAISHRYLVHAGPAHQLADIIPQ
ncbi:MAG: circularly permuted type 2 ATP-grasp protein [Pirellulales bacterium]|nr:circularly permuted type 2 ATP-grasp protein [Pirellulales bacterium]